MEIERVTDAATNPKIRHRYRIRIAVDHPLAADGGQYMDRTFARRNLDLVTPAPVAVGLGDMREGLKHALDDSRFANTEGYQIPIHGTCKPLNTQCPYNGRRPGEYRKRDNLERGKLLTASSWLAQYDRMALMAGEVARGVHQLHHAIDVSKAVTHTGDYGFMVDSVLQLVGEPAFGANARDHGNRAPALAQTIASAYDAGGALTERYVWATGTGGAVLAVRQGGALSWPLPNRQGSMLAWARADGRLGGTFTYDPYGTSPQAGAAGPPHRYAGMMRRPACTTRRSGRTIPRTAAGCNWTPPEPSTG